MELEINCKRCGNCCRGMVWKKHYKFDDAFSMVKEDSSRDDVNDALNSDYIKYLEQIGLPLEKLFKPEWETKGRRIIMRARVGRCKHLSFNEEDLAVCSNYGARPVECSRYLCKKIRNEQRLKKYKGKKKKSLSLLKNMLNICEIYSTKPR